MISAMRCSRLPTLPASLRTKAAIPISASTSTSTTTVAMRPTAISLPRASRTPFSREAIRCTSS